MDISKLCQRLCLEKTLLAVDDVHMIQFQSQNDLSYFSCQSKVMYSFLNMPPFITMSQEFNPGCRIPKNQLLIMMCAVMVPAFLLKKKESY